MSIPERAPLPDVELAQPALTLAQRFIQRWDLYARQLNDGRYLCVHETLGVEQLYRHLRGTLTLGTYVLDEQSRARFVVLDADDDFTWHRLGQLANTLLQEGIPAYREESRRGGHLWLFLHSKVHGRDARAFGRGLLATYEIDGVEVFPKQDRLDTGPGSLIRMPFGVHRVAQRRYGFCRADGSLLAPTIREQLSVLRDPDTVPQAFFDAYRSSMPAKPKACAREPLVASAGVLSERIKASTTVLEFVSQYVDLKPTGSGALGLCPFHDDHRPSFGVNDAENYWNCFAECGGGSVIDFWMKWQKCDFKTAMKELAGMFL
jgi:hypothetical protein